MLAFIPLGTSLEKLLGTWQLGYLLLLLSALEAGFFTAAGTVLDIL
jgi:hypothetical protein